RVPIRNLVSGRDLIAAGPSGRTPPTRARRAPHRARHAALRNARWRGSDRIARRGARGAASCREKDPPLRARGLHAAAQPGTRTKPQRPENACLIRDRRRLAVTSAHAGARRALLRCAERKTGACPPVRWHRGYTSRLPLERSPPRTDWLVTMMRKPQVV